MAADMQKDVSYEPRNARLRKLRRKEEGFYLFDGRRLCEPCMLEEEHVKKHGLWVLAGGGSVTMVRWVCEDAASHGAT